MLSDTRFFRSRFAGGFFKFVYEGMFINAFRFRDMRRLLFSIWNDQARNGESVRPANDIRHDRRMPAGAKDVNLLGFVSISHDRTNCDLRRLQFVEFVTRSASKF